MNDRPLRGRPPGTGKPDDRHLDAVADLLAADADKAPSKAMEEHYATLKDTKLIGSLPTARRRWQVKWAKEGEQRMAGAQERRRNAQAAARRPAAPHASLAYDPFTGLPVSAGTAAYLDMAERQRQLAEMIDPAQVRQMREFAASPEVRAALAFAKSPEFQRTREMLQAISSQGFGPFGHR